MNNDNTVRTGIAGLKGRASYTTGEAKEEMKANMVKLTIMLEEIKGALCKKIKVKYTSNNLLPLPLEPGGVSV